MVRRIRDLNKKVSRILWLLVPFLNIYLLILLFVKKGDTKTDESREKYFDSGKNSKNH
jgi:hypothetical protein